MKVNILLLSGHELVALSIIRCLRAESIINRIDVLSTSANCSTRYSKQINSHFYANTQNDSELLNHLKFLQAKYQSDILVPVFEKDFEFISKNQKTLSTFITVIPVPDFDSFNVALNKRLLAGFSEKNRFPVPRTYYFTDLVQGKLSAVNLSYPLMIKPARSWGGSKIHKVQWSHQLQQFINKHSDQNYILQEYIEGEDLSCNVFYSNGNLITYNIQKRLIREKEFAMSIAIEFIDEPRIIEVVDPIMKKLKWHGVANVDLRYNPETDSYYLIEINPRFWGNIIASEIATGINFPAILVHAALGKNIYCTKTLPGRFMFFTKYIKYKIKKPGQIKNLIKFKDTNYTSYLNDPAPYCYITLKNYWGKFKTRPEQTQAVPADSAPVYRYTDNNLAAQA